MLSEFVKGDCFDATAAHIIINYHHIRPVSTVDPSTDIQNYLNTVWLTIVTITTGTSFSLMENNILL